LSVSGPESCTHSFRPFRVWCEPIMLDHT
jgi:hypothetical protein